MSEILLINLLGASESKVQMVVFCGTVSATVLVTPLVTLFLKIAQCSWALLSSLRACCLRPNLAYVPGFDLFL